MTIFCVSPLLCLFAGPLPGGAQGRRSPSKKIFAPPGKICWTFV